MSYLRVIPRIASYGLSALKMAVTGPSNLRTFPLVMPRYSSASEVMEAAERNTITVDGHKLLLIETRHDDPIFAQVARELVLKASGKQVAVFLEGVPREDESESLFAKKVFTAPSKGYVFGLENGFLNHLVFFIMKHLELTYSGRIDPAKRKELIVDGITGLVISNMFGGHYPNLYWQELSISYKFGFKKLFNDVDQFVRSADDGAMAKIKEFALKNENHAQFIPLVRKMIKLMLPEAKRMGVETVYIEDMLWRIAIPDKLEQFKDSIVMRIRNRFMADNIRSVLKDLPPDIMVYVWVGAEHLRGLSHLLKYNSEDLFLPYNHPIK